MIESVTGARGVCTLVVAALWPVEVLDRENGSWTESSKGRDRGDTFVKVSFLYGLFTLSPGTCKTHTTHPTTGRHV